MWIDQKFILIKKILHNQKGSLIDLGSRDQILKKFIPSELQYTGVDIKQNSDNSNKILDLNKKLDYEDNSFDFATALDIAEHLNDPENFIKECLRISRKKVFLVLPNISYYEGRFLFLLTGSLGDKYHFSGNDLDDRHKWFTNYHLISDFFEKKFDNFNITKIIKTRNKIKPLFYIEKSMAKYFPNLFSWSFLITIEKG